MPALSERSDKCSPVIRSRRETVLRPARARVGRAAAGGVRGGHVEADIEQQADAVLRPFREAAERLATMPGVSETVARVIIAEVGVDMTQFPSAGHLVSWAGLCPRLDESAGKRRSTRIRHATPWLKTALVQAAWAATRKNGSYLQAQFRRLKGRRGPKKAIVAVAASMLTAAYFMLRDETDYHDLGGRYLANRDKQRVTQSLLRRLRNLGVEVEVKAA